MLETGCGLGAACVEGAGSGSGGIGAGGVCLAGASVEGGLLGVGVGVLDEGVEGVEEEALMTVIGPSLLYRGPSALMRERVTVLTKFSLSG
jgi:hypothetical protein